MVVLVKKKVKRAVFIFHFLMLVIFFLFKDLFPDALDSKLFYNQACNVNSWFSLFKVGTPFISFLLFPLVKVNLNYAAITVLFSCISLCGYLTYINLIFKENKIEVSYHVLLVLLVLFFTPSFHYWTNLIGKDSIIFFLMAFLLRLISFKLDNYKVIFAVLLLISMIRPYLTIILLISYCIHFFVNNDLSYKKVISLSIISIIILFFALLNVKTFLGVQFPNKNMFEFFFNRISDYSSNHGNSSINFEKSTYLDRIILLMQRPFFFESYSFSFLVSSLENLIMLYVYIYSFFTIFLKISINAVYKNFFPLICSILLILFFGIYIYNIGLASRMRVMVLPYILYVIYRLNEYKLYNT